MDSEILSFAFYTFLWTASCIIVENVVDGQSKNDHDIKNRIISIIHGFLTLILSSHHILTTPFEYCTVSSSYEQFIIKISVSYFIYDYIACLYYGIWDKNLVIHHTSSISGFLVSYYVPIGAKISILGLMVAESSNFPMHMRVILRLKGLRHTKMFNLCEILYLVVYVVVRGGICLPMLLSAIMCKEMSIIVTLMCGMLCVQSYYFIWQIFPILKHKWAELRELKDKNVETFWLEHNPKVEELHYFKISKSQKIF